MEVGFYTRGQGLDQDLASDVDYASASVSMAEITCNLFNLSRVFLGGDKSPLRLNIISHGAFRLLLYLTPSLGGPKVVRSSYVNLFPAGGDCG